ncbi:MAG: benzaldehyde dehydrogenase [Deltaproteobacteria bacterium]|nr:benzaldehyde dehydrogenase [Deltaproteobacteria bacterium]
MTASNSILDSSPWKGKFFNGDWVDAPNISEVIEPATRTVLTTCGLAGASDIFAATKAALAAQKEWAKTSVRDRATVFLKAAEYLTQNAEELAVIIARETGGIIPKGQHEVREAVVLLQMAAGMCFQPDGLTLPSAPGKLSYARRIPLGVVGVISPFNFPLFLSLRSVAPALAAGNAVVTKPDTQTSVTGGYIMAMAFEAAGLPKGLYHVMPGGAEAGEALCSAKEVGMVAFTGSTAVGRKVGEVCGRNLKKVSLELGGKSSLIILEDADLELAAKNIAFGAFFHQGQICMASGRVLVHEKVVGALTKIMVEKAGHLPVGDPMSGQVALGPLINERQAQKVDAIIQDSISAGATLEVGGKRDGLFYSPTVLSGVKPGMRCFEEEIFGPVVNIVSFSSDDEAVALANNTEYGLAGAVISANISRARKIGEQLNVGLLHINDQTVVDECVNPFGGCGISGNGSNVCGPADWETYTHWQWVTIKDEPPAYPF